MKINFKQPKYIIPILVLPFLLLFYYIFSGSGDSRKKDIAVGDSTDLNKGINSININMPGVSKDIANGEIKDKFTAFQEAYRNNRDYSALSSIDPTKTGGGSISNLQSNYTEEEIQRLAAEKKLDSLNSMLKMGQQDIDKQMSAFNKGNQTYSPNNSSSSGRKYASLQGQKDPISDQLNRLNNNAGNSGSKKDGESYDDQMKLFRDQMNVMDSLQKQYAGGAGSEGGNKQNKKNTMLNTDDKDRFNPNNDTTFKPVHISMTKGEMGRFNTVRGFTEEQNIMAIIDQDIKAIPGSRIRIRLLNDIFAGEYLIPKGTYIYGIVTGFQTQRVNISITQLFYNNTPIPVKLDVFDNDGYLGLYVPGSNFREFSKEIGTQGTNGLSSFQTSDNSNVMTGIATQVFQKTTTSVANMIKRDKAFLKYNYIIYLKEKKNKMKIISLFAIVLLTGSIAAAQDSYPAKDSMSKLLPNSVTVNENNIIEFNIPVNATTHIISPEPILYADISTPDVEGDIQDKNILRIKPSGNIAENQSFTVTVVTRVFVAVYKLICVSTAKSLKDTNPPTYVISVDPNKAVQLNQSNALSQQQCYSLSMQALAKKRKIKNIAAKAYGLSVWINNIYIVGDYLLFDIGAKNKSNLQFDLDQVRFKIKDRFRVNAAVSQDLELQPMFQFYNNENSVITGTWRNFYIFKKFTYPTQKIFSVEFTEQQISGRKVELTIGYNQVLKSRFLL